MDNQIAGNKGDNALAGGGGNDSFYGDHGLDTVTLGQPMAAYELQYAGGALTLTSATDTTVLRQVEKLQFADQEQMVASFYLKSAKDANGDGRADIYWRNMADGQVSEWLMDRLDVLEGTVFSDVPLDWVIA